MCSYTWKMQERTLTKLQIRLTQKNIKICLTERWYSWEEARVAAMEDEEVDLYANTDKGQSAYLPKELTEVRPPY
jgi:large subunit ribosomal protein L47